MKKSYQKPSIYVEAYELAQSIAANCGILASGSTLGRPTHSEPGVNNCGWALDKDVIIFIENTSCTEIEDPSDFNKDHEDLMCYNAPTANTQIFASA